MSGPFSIAAVTAVLKDLLNNGLIDHDLSAVGNVTVTALPPDRIAVSSGEEKSQLNVFMFQVAANSALRNAQLPARGARGERLTNPALAIDLRYLVTAYGEREFHAEVLLGYAMQLLHETPVLTRAMIRAALTPALPPEVSLPPALAMLSTADLAEQAELIKITHYDLNTEEMSRLWAAMQAKYRPTAAYQVSVVLIDSDRPARAALPVLERGAGDRGAVAQADTVARFASLDAFELPNRRTQALLGDTVVLRGGFLAGDTGNPSDVDVRVRIAGTRLSTPLELNVAPADRSATRITFTLPNTPHSLFAGVYTLSIRVMPVGTPDAERTSNELPLLIAPQFATPLAPVVRTGIDPVTQLGTATLTLTCTPDVVPEQRVSAVVGSKEVAAEAHAAQTNLVTFIVRGLEAGDHWLRLRVDGAESALIDRSDPNGLRFDPAHKLGVA